jgi:hypothetical protein
MSRLPFLAVLLLLAAAGAFLMVRVGEVYDCRLCDYDTYAAAGERILTGQPLYAEWQFRPYRLLEAARGNGFVYPPSSAVLLTWAAWTPPLLWRVINLAGLLLVTVLVMRHRGLTATAVAATLLMLFSPMWNAWANGQVTPLLAAGFGLAWLYPRWAWLIAGIGGAIKLFPLILLAWVLRERGWREVGYGVVAAAAVVIVTMPITGTDPWPQFAEVLRNGESNCAYPPINSLRCVLGPSVGPEVGQLIAFVIAGALSVAALVVGSRPFAFILLCAAVIAAAPDLNRPYWLFLFIGGLVVAGAVDWRSESRRLLRRLTDHSDSAPRQTSP